MKTTWIPILICGILLQPLAFADVSYQETTQITGGSLVGMVKLAGAFSSQARQASVPTTSQVFLHGDRMVRSNAHDTEIIDLGQQTITTIDRDRHTYSVVTFEQMRQAMARASAQSRKQPAQANSSGTQMSFDAHATTTGATQTIDGRTAKEALVSVTMLANANDGSNAKGGMAAVSEIWLEKDVPGIEELRRFNLRLAQEIASDTGAMPGAAMLAAQPGASEAMDNLRKEAAKMSGVPVLQVTRIGISADGQPLAAPSATPLPSNQGGGATTGKVTGEVATDTGTQVANSEMGKLGTFGRALGSSGMGALMRHKPSGSAPAQAPANSSGSAASNVLLESRTSTSGFSTAPVDAGAFEIPSGYRQVTSPLAKRAS